MLSGNAVVKSYSSFAVNDMLIAKLVEAVKQGEASARSTGQVRRFEVFYHGRRQDLVLGHIMIVPAKVADSIETFPATLLYGQVVKEMSGETVSDLFEHTCGESEFDNYQPRDLLRIKDALFKDGDGKYRCLVVFIPTWSVPRDYVVFKMVKDDTQLAMMLRHQVFGCYFDPRLSSAFDMLSTDLATNRVDVTDISPKLNFPFLAENPFKQYPEMEPGDKKASRRKPRTVLAHDSVEALEGDLLAPGEQAVLNALTEVLNEKVDGNIEEPLEAADRSILEEVKAPKEVAKGAKKACNADGSHKPGCPHEHNGASESKRAFGPRPEDYTREVEIPTRRGYGKFYQCSDCRALFTNPEQLRNHSTVCPGPKAAPEQQKAAGKQAGRYEWQSWQDEDSHHWHWQIHRKGVMGAKPVSEGSGATQAEALKKMKESLHALGVGNEGMAVSASAERVVLATGGSRLHRRGAALIAVAADGYRETLRINASKVRYVQPNRFNLSFRNRLATWLRNPRNSASKVADVPQTFDDIWGDKMDDLGAAPEVALKGEGAASTEAGRNGEKKQEGTPTVEKEAARRTCATCGKSARHVGGLREVYPGKFYCGSCVPDHKVAKDDKKNEEHLVSMQHFGDKKYEHSDVPCKKEKAGSFFCDKCHGYFLKTLKDAGKIASSGSFSCALCGKGVHSDSELCQTCEKEHACEVCGKSLNGNGAWSEIAPERCIHGACQTKAKAAAFNMFIPGQVAKEFYPELLQESVDYPSDTYSEAITDFGPGAEGAANVSTSPAGGIGIGRDGKAQVLEGAPLRKENDIRGYGFDQEFYQQYDGISSEGLSAGVVLAGVRKRADSGEYKAQFRDFLVKAMGEVAATFIAAFKVTNRPMFEGVPGTGEIKLDQVEQPSMYVGLFGNSNGASRVRFLVSKLNDSELQDGINAASAQASVWNESPEGGFKYEVFCRPEKLDPDTLELSYSYVVQTVGL